MEEYWETMDFVPTSAGGSSQVDRILDSIPNIVDAFRRPRPPAPALTPPPATPAPAGAATSSLVLFAFIGVLIWAVS
jgi:hypothetical protein